MLYQQKTKSKKHDPTHGIILGGVYEYQHEHNKNPDIFKEVVIVESFTAYDSEGKLLGNGDFPIYHAIVKLITTGKNLKTHEQSNLRLSPEFISINFKYMGVSFIK